MSKTAGHIMSMSLNITQPTKFDIPKMEFNKIALFVGPNGSGKSLIMKINWCFSMIANYFAAGKTLGLPIDYKKEFQLIMDKSFDDNNFDGVIEAFFENATIYAEFKNGQVVDLSYTSDEDLVPGKFPVFMSRETRTFESFVKYMKMKKSLGIENIFQTFTNEELEMLTNIYKLYDLLFMEQMLIGLNGYTLDDETKKAFKEQFEMKPVIDQVLVDQNECEIYILDKESNTKSKITRLSAGEQSIFNMIVAPKIV